MATERTIMIQIGADGRAATAEMDRVSSRTGKLGSDMKSFSLSTDGASSSLLSLGASTATLYAIGAAMKSSIDAANQMERSTIALAVTARYAGAGIDTATQAAKNLTKDGLMSVAEASQSLQNLLSRGFSLDQAVTMMNRLKDSASFNRQAHLEFGASIVGATEGLKNENSVLVDNAGVTKNVSMMWKEYAQEHGKTVDSLSQAEKRQAEYNGILKETEGQAGNTARMMATLSGAQSKFTQEIFSAKAAFGESLTPALRGTLSVITPVVSGMRDLVYGVQMLGANAAALWEKTKLRAEIAMSGKGMFSKEGLAEYEKRVIQINAILEETYKDIFNKAEGAVLPDIGADTGKRRQDTKKTDKKKTERSATPLDLLKQQILSYEKDMAAAAVQRQKWFDTGMQLVIDDAAGIYHWAAVKEENRQDELAMQTEFFAMQEEQRGNSFQRELLAIDAEQAALEEKWAKNTDSFAVHAERQNQIQQFYDKKRADASILNEQRQAQLKLQVNQNYLNGITSILNAAYAISGSRNKALYALTQATAIATTFLSTEAAAATALAPPPLGLGPVAGIPLATSIKFSGYASMAAMAATSIANIAGLGQNSVSSSGGGDSSGGLVGMNNTYGYSANGAAPLAPQQAFTVHIYGNVVDNDKFARELMVSLQKAAKDGY